MKLRLIAILLLFYSCTNGQAFYQPMVWGQYPVGIGGYTNLTSVFLVNQTNSNKYKITGTTSGWYIGQLIGTDTSHPVEIWVVGHQIVNGGISIENSSKVKIIAPEGLELQSGGVPLAVKGQTNFIQISGVTVLNGVNGAIWVKTEVSEACSMAAGAPAPYNVLADYLYPKHMRNIWVTNCRIGRPNGTGASGGDAFYLGSTGSKGDRPVPCLGNSFVKPMYMSGVHALYDTVYNCGRSAIQMSGTDSGINEMSHNFIYNIGREYSVTGDPSALNQGAGIRTGFGDGNNIEIAYNVINKTLLYNIDGESGANIHDNWVDSSGFWGSIINPQQIQNVICAAAQPNSVLKLKFNQSPGHSTQPQHKVYTIYGGSNFSTVGNDTCGNNPRVYLESTPFIATTCGGGTDTICHDTTYQIQHDTLITVTIPQQITTRDTQIILTNSIARNTHLNKTYTIVTRTRIKDSTVNDTIPAHDTTFICRLCATHDTTRTICIIVSSFVKPETKLEFAKLVDDCPARNYKGECIGTYLNYMPVLAKKYYGDKIIRK